MADKPRKNIIRLVAVTLLIVVIILIAFLWLYSRKPNSIGWLYPTNGEYSVEETNIVCSQASPPICEGSVVVHASDVESTLVDIDSKTIVRYINLPVQVYADSLKRGVSGTVTFRPNSATIEIFTIKN